MSFGLQFVAQFLKIIDLAVAGDPNGPILVGHGLPSVFAQVDDTEPSMA
jgi:hypothetical protein